MAVQYIHLTHEEYKLLEKQMRAFKETTHKTEGGFYHKSIRLTIAKDFILEYHGPLVGGYGHNEKPENKLHCRHGKTLSSYCQECAVDSYEEQVYEDFQERRYKGE